MKTWFICKIKYQKQDEKGKVKNVTDSYLVDAVSFCEAETKMYKKIEEHIQGDFFIQNISKSNYTDVFHYEDADTWFNCKMTYTLEVEGSGREKTVTNYILLTAKDVEEAYTRVFDSLKEMLVDFEVPEVKATKIVDAFAYESEADEKWKK